MAVNVPESRPGRGMTRDKLHFLSGLPRIDGSSDDETLSAGVSDAVTRINAAWQGRTAPKVRLLPEVYDYEDLLEIDTKRESKLIPIGINEAELAPVYLDFNADPHFYAFADSESGKTNLLRQIVRGISDRYTTDEALIILVDYRRTMLGFIEGDQLLSYVVSADQLSKLMVDVEASMKKRLPGPDLTQEELKNRSWWKGPELFVIVDDYDLVMSGSSGPLDKLAPFLPQAKDVGLHLVTVRRTGGASRALYDKILGKLKETAQPGLLMSGPREEGFIFGKLRPQQLPPGRGIMVTRKRGNELMQVSWIDPP
jgi:S-DNA-T family DNA segregation ATPase FtsK/SpoIIIE